jgi:hypothetical protein
MYASPYRRKAVYVIKSKNIKSIRNHAEAKARYESIKPLRGRVSDVRPLGPRRYTYINIKHNEVDGAYCVVLHQTPIVTYYPSGVIKLDNGGWQTASTKAIMNEVLPFGMAITTTNPMRVRVMDKGEFAFNGTREVLRRYQDFLTWGKGYLSLVDNLIYDDTPTTENERQEMRAMQMMAQNIHSPYPKRWMMEDSNKVQNQQRRAFLDRIDGTHNADTDLRYENYLYAMKIIGVVMGVMQHRDGRWARMVVSMSKVREFLIALHAPEIIDAVALPAGQTAPRSKWAAWMNGWVKDAYPTNG